jgi:hypothetical protein
MVSPSGTYRCLLVSFTDRLWVEIPISYGQVYRRFMVSLNFKIPANTAKMGRAGELALSVCLFNTVYVVNRKDAKPKW